LIDKNLIQGKIDLIEKDLQFLKQYESIQNEEFLNNYKDIQAVKYSLFEMIEASIDIASHIISIKGFERAESYAEMFEILGKKNIFVFIIIILLIIVFLLKKLLSKEIKPTRPSGFKCLDGHIVKSKGELIIDNNLKYFGIQHEYESIVNVYGNKIKSDWYLPEYELYIEYWGFFGKKYENRKKEKIKLYQKGKLKLISIEEAMLSDIYSNLKNQLENYIEINNLEKHCPNCGNKLDDRF